VARLVSQDSNLPALARLYQVTQTFRPAETKPANELCDLGGLLSLVDDNPGAPAHRKTKPTNELCRWEDGRTPALICEIR
jgi:hypothetical protein